MSLSLYSEDGWVSNLSSNWAAMRFINSVNTVSSAPELNQFFTQGYTDKIPEVIDDLSTTLPKITDQDAKGFGQKLKSGLELLKDKEIAIISQ